MATDPARDAAVLRPPLPEPRLARAGRPGAAHRAVADGVALPLVLGDPLARRLRPDAPGPGGPVRPALADRLPRPVRALADPGRLLPADGPGQRRLPRHARVHLDRAAGGQRRGGQPVCRDRRGRGGGPERDRRGPGLFPALHRGPARLDGLAGDRPARADRGADPLGPDPRRRPLPPAGRRSRASAPPRRSSGTPGATCADPEGPARRGARGPKCTRREAPSRGRTATLGPSAGA